MERKEPTMSTGVSEPVETTPRRNPSLDDDIPPPRPTRPPAPKPVYATQAPANSSLPAIALVIALVAVGGAGFLGWQLFQAQEVMKQAEVRIQGLEQQLNLTSEESSASVVSLQANLKKLDADVRKLAANLEDNRKATAANLEKITAVGRETAIAKKDGSDAKNGLNSLKQDVEANKAVADAAATKIDSAATSISQQNKAVQDVKEQIAKLRLELEDFDGLASRMRTNEEAISAIDEYRRSTNRDILQIKQQLGLTPK